MCQRIFKYPAVDAVDHDFELPWNAIILDLQVQDDVPTIWALVTPETECGKTKRYRIHPTGSTVSAGAQYVGTFQKGWFVGHVFSTFNPQNRSNHED